MFFHPSLAPLFPGESRVFPLGHREIASCWMQGFPSVLQSLYTFPTPVPHHLFIPLPRSPQNSQSTLLFIYLFIYLFYIRQVMCRCCNKVWREAHVTQQHEHPFIMLMNYKRISTLFL